MCEISFSCGNLIFQSVSFIVVDVIAVVTSVWNLHFKSSNPIDGKLTMKEKLMQIIASTLFSQFKRLSPRSKHVRIMKFLARSSSFSLKCSVFREWGKFYILNCKSLHGISNRYRFNRICNCAEVYIFFESIKYFWVFQFWIIQYNRCLTNHRLQ